MKPPPTAQSRTIRISGGGTITLTVAVDLFEIDEKERALIFGLLDAIAEHERKLTATEDPAPP